MSAGGATLHCVPFFQAMPLTTARALEPALGGAAVGRASLERELQQLHPSCWAWALAVCRWDRSEAEDVLQSAYLKLLDGSAAFRGDSSLRTFAFAVIRHTAADRRRRRLVATLGLHALFEGRSAAPGRDAGPEDRTSVRCALAGLPARQREVLELVFFHELTLDEAAQVMKVSPGSARTHYHRGKARLSEVLR